MANLTLQTLDYTRYWAVNGGDCLTNNGGTLKHDIALTDSGGRHIMLMTVNPTGHVTSYTNTGLCEDTPDSLVITPTSAFTIGTLRVCYKVGTKLMNSCPYNIYFVWFTFTTVNTLPQKWATGYRIATAVTINGSTISLQTLHHTTYGNITPIANNRDGTCYISSYGYLYFCPNAPYAAGTRFVASGFLACTA